MLPVALRSLRHRNFRLFAAGQLVSMTGTWIQLVAQSWLVYRLTGRATLLGLVGFAGNFPIFLLAPIGGALADRFERRKIIVVTQAISMVLAFVLAALTLGGIVREWHIVALAAGLGIIHAFDIPARQSFLVEMVGREDLINAIGLNSSLFNGARMAGPAVAGLLVALIGEGWCFLINALSFAAVLVALLAIRVPPFQAPAKSSTLSRIREGFAFSARERPVRALLVMLAILSLTGMPYIVLMPVFAERVLFGGPAAYGILMSAAGMGALTGAIVLASKRDVRGLGGWVARAAIGFGSLLAVFSLSRSMWLSVLLLLPIGFTMMVQISSSNTLIQTMVPDALRGRVMSVYSMMFMGMAPLGALLAGWSADRIGAPTTVLIGGAACVAAAAIFRWSLPRLRADARRLIVAQQAVGGEPPAGVSAI
ncbi:MAG TPA: MFS transporter [Gemmatimonadota bacterium]|nr:MFS transporter [Gemmatimonadota bacterium]